MSDPTTVLVSRQPGLIEVVRRAHDTHPSPRLVLCGGPGHAYPVLECSDVFLLITHLTNSRDTEDCGGLLRLAAGRRQASAALVCDDDVTYRHARARLDDGKASLLCLPRDSGKLVRLMNEAFLRADLSHGEFVRRPEAGAAPGLADLGIVEPEHLTQIRRVVDQDTTILLTGETGTGKTMLARHIHQTSARKNKPFMIVDCGALAAALIESEMFGHTRGSFTGAEKDRLGKFAAAGDGTLVLDEINSLPLALQPKLLRAVEERLFEPLGSNNPHPLKARIIAISNVPLHQEVAKERFRADLYYRLNVVGFRLPPLRERWADVLPLARKFLSEHPVAKARGIIGIAPEALRAMEAYSWPGNMREVKNLIERLAVVSVSPVARFADLPECVRLSATNSIKVSTAPTTHLQDAMSPAGRPDDDERRIREALRKHGNNRGRAAAELGMSRVSLFKRLRKYGLVIPRNPVT